MATVSNAFAVCQATCDGSLEYDGFCAYAKKGEATIFAYSGTGGDIVIPDTIDGYPVTTIQSNAFQLCDGITGVTIGNNVEVIGKKAFITMPNLTYVIISESVVEIQAGAFSDNPLLSYVIMGSNVDEVGNNAFCPDSNLTTVFFTGDPPTNWTSDKVFCPDTQMFTTCVSDNSTWTGELPPDYDLDTCEPECDTNTDCPVDEECIGFQCEEETLITLSGLEASWQPAGVVIRWFTETEIDNSHFNLYRAESKKKFRNWRKKGLKRGLRKKPYVKINPVPIPADTEAFGGAAYEYIDTSVRRGRRYWYMLEDVDFYGLKTWHGACWPVSKREDCSYVP